VESRSNSAYVAKLVSEEPLSPDMLQTFRAGAGARFITVEKVPSGLFAAKIFSTVNETQIGYVATVEIATTTLGVNDSVGVFAADDGARYVVFSYDSVTGGNFTLLSEGVEYRLNFDHTGSRNSACGLIGYFAGSRRIRTQVPVLYWYWHRR